VQKLLSSCAALPTRIPAAKRLPQARADDPQAALSLAVMRLRALPAWGVDSDIEQLCRQAPPFGIADAPDRIHSALWSVPEERNASMALRNNTSPGSAARACVQLGQVIHRVTGRPRRTAFSTCAVVGSSGGLKGSRQGELIDAHDAVVRFNTAPTGGQYAADVGNRTSLWVASHVPWRSQLRTRVGLASEEEAALYCFNPWLGTCFNEALSGRARDARGRPSTPLLVSPLVTSAMMAIQVC
jgi:hypothetical protein